VKHQASGYKSRALRPDIGQGISKFALPLTPAHRVQQNVEGTAEEWHKSGFRVGLLFGQKRRSRPIGIVRLRVHVRVIDKIG